MVLLAEEEDEFDDGDRDAEEEQGLEGVSRRLAFMKRSSNIELTQSSVPLSIASYCFISSSQKGCLIKQSVVNTLLARQIINSRRWGKRNYDNKRTT